MCAVHRSEDVIKVARLQYRQAIWNVHHLEETVTWQIYGQGSASLVHTGKQESGIAPLQLV